MKSIAGSEGDVFRTMDTVVTQVEQHGFAIVDGLFGRNEVQQLADDLAHAELKRSKAGVRHTLTCEAVASLAEEPRLLEVTRAILGSDAAPFRATVFDKSPSANWLVVWHQDTALPLRERRHAPGWGPWSVKEGVIYAHAPASALSQVLALRVHLDDSSLQNGPLRVLPGTHLNGVFSDDQIGQLATRIKCVDCVVQQGGVMAMRPLLVHASSKSQSEMPRRVLHIEYSAAKAFAMGLELATA
jgi:ectoine hydroxylase-related dioxygenase (phytanoyl-CoA dioxygenase family)